MTDKMGANILSYYSAETKKKLESASSGGKNAVNGPALLDLGESVPGSTQRFKVLVKNEHPNGFSVHLRNPTTTDKDLRIEKYPESLKSGQSEAIEFVYSPAKDRIDPLKAKWAFDIVVVG